MKVTTYWIALMIVGVINLVKHGVDAAALRADAGPPPPVCFIEEGYDFVDNDIGNAKAAKAEDCCALCYVTLGCKAFSWSNYNGGTCWFKSGRGTVVVNPNVRSALVFTIPGPPTCQLLTDIDFVDNDIGHTSATKPEDCCALCKNFPGCRAYSWNDYNGGTCWYKSKKGRTIVKAGVKSAEVYPAPYPPMCALEPGVDYVNNDIGSVQRAKPEECCDACQKFAGCRAFSWTNLNGGTCWLKNLYGDIVANPNVTSAVVLSNPTPPSCSLESGVDYVDNDIGNVPSKDPYACCSICTTRTGCKAFSWSDHNGGTCWLKSKKGDTIAKANVKSAVVVV
jgi:hypothetical protein